MILLAIFCIDVARMEKLDGDKFYQAMMNLVRKTLNLEEIQGYLNNTAEYDSPQPPDGQEMLTNIVEDLSRVFKGLKDAVKSLRDSVQTVINSGPHIQNNATKLPQTDVNMDEMCVWWGSAPSQNSGWVDDFLETAKKNKEKIPKVKWQYVAFKENYLAIYPSTKLPNCSQEGNPIGSKFITKLFNLSYARDKVVFTGRAL